MAWQDAIAEIDVSHSCTGSGFLVAPDRVLTAGHVLAPNWPQIPLPLQVTVKVGGVPFNVVSFTVHPRWRFQGLGSGDMALLRLGAPSNAPTLSVVMDYQPSSSADSGGGCPQGVMVGPVSVALSRRQQSSGFDMYWGTGLVAPLGISGGPLLVGDGTTMTAVGVITAVATDPSATVFVGLPLLQLTYGQLRDQT